MTNEEKNKKAYTSYVLFLLAIATMTAVYLGIGLKRQQDHYEKEAAHWDSLRVAIYTDTMGTPKGNQ